MKRDGSHEPSFCCKNYYIEILPLKTADALGLSYNTVATAIKNLCTLGILDKSKSESRSKTFAYTDYLNILKKGTE